MIPVLLGGIGEKKSNGGTQYYQQDRIYDGDKIAIAVTTSFLPWYAYRKENKMEDTKELTIRKLTPKECYRLMGFDDIDCDRAKEVISDTWIYYTAGDSIVVNLLEDIFKELL